MSAAGGLARVTDVASAGGAPGLAVASRAIPPAAQCRGLETGLPVGGLTGADLVARAVGGVAAVEPVVVGGALAVPRRRPLATGGAGASVRLAVTLG